MLVTLQDGRQFLRGLRDVQLLWTDPPYGTGKTQTLKSTGESYEDQADPVELITETLTLGLDTLTPDGVMAVCLDRRAIHRVVAIMEQRANYLGDIIWHYETGGVSKKFWSQKHDTIAMFANSGKPRFNLDFVPTVERKAPVRGYVNPKRVSSVWNINMSTSDSQRVGYPTQKPLELLYPFIEVHTDPGELVVDPFAGSGTTVAAALSCGRLALGCDTSQAAVEIANKRLEDEGLL